MFRKILMLTAGASLVIATHAFSNPVQINGAGSPAQAQVYGNGSAAAAASQRQGQTQGQTATGGNARATGGRGGSSNVNVTNTVRSGNGGGSNNGGNAIGLTVPGGYGNAPCGGGIGLGGLGLSGGGSGGGTLWEFGDCKRMRESSALLQLGYPDAALAELCQIDRVREAFGGRCPGEPGAMMVQMVPQPIAEPQPVHAAFCDPHTSVVWQDGSCHHKPKPVPHITLQAMTCHDLIVETLRECHQVKP